MSAKKDPVKGANQQGVGPVIYLGPNVLMKALKTYTVYKQEPTELISSLQEEYKTVKRLFVPVADMNRAQKELKKKGTPISLAYQELIR